MQAVGMARGRLSSAPRASQSCAVVSLHNQRITSCDANGWILRAPVSSGQKRRHTLAGISPSKLLSITPEPAAKPKPCFRVRHGEI